MTSPGQSDSSEEPCGNSNCSDLVGDSNGIKCDFCKHWFHLTCTKLDEKSYKFLSKTKFDSIIWKCDTCPSLDRILNDQHAHKFAEFEKTITEKIDKIETNISKKINLAY